MGRKDEKHSKANPRRLKNVVDLQATNMLIKASNGVSIKELAKEFDVSARTVKKRLNDSKQRELVELAREIATERLLSKALAVVNKRLDEGDYKAAKDILSGLGVYVSNDKVIVKSSSNPLDAIREEIIDVDVDVKEKNE